MTTVHSGPEGNDNDAGHLAALRRGDEAAFVMLLNRYHGSLLRVALVYVGDRAVAEEVVQETWLGMIHQLDRFEARSSLKTWLFRILTNCAKTRAQREGRSLPFSALAQPATMPDEFAVDPERFRPTEPWQGHWALPPRRWDDTPEAHVLAGETAARLQQAIAALPPTQQAVLLFRDAEGLTTQEVCQLLGLTAANERVLLHRARSRVRRALEQYFNEE